MPTTTTKTDLIPLEIGHREKPQAGKGHLCFVHYGQTRKYEYGFYSSVEQARKAAEKEGYEITNLETFENTEIVNRLATDPFNKTALLAIKNGADISGPRLARTLRRIEKDHPEILTITKVQGKYGVHEKLPYFGAILTGRGKDILSKL